MFVLWLISCYLCGALPWSVWLGTFFFHADPRKQRDRNPGAANAFRAAGWRLGIAVLALDFSKAFIPVAAAHWLAGYADQRLFWIALMPTVGHAFSVFLRFRGGRGLVSMFGVWAGLTLATIPAVMGITAVSAVALLKRDEYRTVAIPLVLIAYLLLTHAAGWMVMLACAQLMLLAVKLSAYLVEQRKQRRLGAT